MLRTVLAVLATMTLLTGAVFSQPSNEQIDLVSIPLDYSTVSSIQVQGGYAYAISPVGINVFDISNPSSPEKVSFASISGFPRSLVVDGHYAYVTASDNGVLVFNIQSPESIYLVGSLDLATWYFNSSFESSLCKLGDYLFTIVENRDNALEQGWMVIDVTDPANPEQVVFYDEGDYWAWDLALNDEDPILYVSTDSSNNGSGGVQSFDISDPTNPQFIDQWDAPAYCESITYHDGRVYFIGLIIEQYLTVWSMHVLDAVYYGSLEEQYAFVLPDRRLNLTAQDAELWVSSSGGPISVYDISQNPWDIGLIGEFDGVNATWICLDGDLAYLDGPVVLNIADPASPEILYQYATDLGLPIDLDIADGITFVGVLDRGVQIYDLSDPEDPVMLSEIQGISDIVRLRVSGSLLFVDAWPYCYIYDVSDPSQPVPATNWDGLGITSRIVIDNNLAIQADGTCRILDVTDPLSPQLLGEVELTGYATSIAVAGDYAYIATGFLNIVDISDPANPAVVNVYHVAPGDVDFVAIEGNTAYVMYAEGELAALDLTDPEEPVVISSIEVPHIEGRDERDLIVRDGYAYVANSYLSVVNVSDPANMLVVGTTEPLTTLNGMDVDDDGLVYLAESVCVSIFDPAAALSVHEHRTGSATPSQFTLSPAFPNPFNAATSFTVTLPASSELDLDVFNVTGQRVTTLFHGTRPAGQHRFSFDASNLASGVYFLRATTPDQFTATQKVMLVR